MKAIAILVVFGALIYLSPQVPWPGSCNLGVNGMAAKIRYSGLGAERTCQQALEQYPSYYRIDGARTSAETVRCQRTTGGLEVTITDTGAGLVAMSMCGSLK